MVRGTGAYACARWTSTLTTLVYRKVQAEARRRPQFQVRPQSVSICATDAGYSKDMILDENGTAVSAARKRYASLRYPFHPVAHRHQAPRTLRATILTIPRKSQRKKSLKKKRSIQLKTNQNSAALSVENSRRNKPPRNSRPTATKTKTRISSIPTMSRRN